MGEHRRGEKLHVVRQNEIPALEQRPGLRGALEVNAGAHARGQQHVRPRPDGLHQGDDVRANRGRRDHAQACFLELDHLAHVDHCGKVGDGITVLASGEDLHRFGVCRRTHLGREHEAVELRLGQRIRAVELGGVLRRHHEEWAVERPCGALDGHLAFPHRFEQRGLRARRRAVDLVGEDDVGEDRTCDKFEGHVFLVEHARARDVGGQQVRRALDAAERASDRCRQGAGEHRLAGARQVLEEDVAARDQAGNREPHDAVLADDHPVDVLLDSLEQLGRALRLERLFLGRHVVTQSSGGSCDLRHLPGSEVSEGGLISLLRNSVSRRPSRRGL